MCLPSSGHVLFNSFSYLQQRAYFIAVSDPFKTFFWLLISYRVTHRLFHLALKAFHDMTSLYLSELLSFHPSPQSGINSLDPVLL